MRYQTVRTEIQGAICGALWQPGFDNYGRPHHECMRRRFARFSDPRGATFRDALLSSLMENGGDFRNARFTADTVLIIERRAPRRDGKRGFESHIRELEIARLPDCADLVAPDTFAGDYCG